MRPSVLYCGDESGVVWTCDISQMLNDEDGEQEMEE